MGSGIIVMLLLTSRLLCGSSELSAEPCSKSDYVYEPSAELPLGRWNFPEGFVFSTATSSYQIEGASNIDGKGPSVWDRFTHDSPDRIEDGGNGDVALDHSHRFMEGIEFYHKLLDALIENEIDAYVTIWHWDTPQALEAEYGGFLSRDIVACREGDSGIEPYIVGHNLLLAHSAAYHLYKNKYQNLTAEIGVTYVTHWFVPYSNATKDVDAAQRALDWMYGWLMDPITYGNYPRTMVDLLGSRLPQFTEEESLLLRKSYDFLGLNYYTGLSDKDNATQTLVEALRDESRINFYNNHLTSVQTAMKEKQVNVKGYFAWSYADNFEWNEGYTVRFGLNYVNYTDLSRHPKHSACWFTNFCNKTKPNSFDLHHLFTTASADAPLGGRRALSSSTDRLN
ncbi:Beta-glucosidase 12 [Linum perenne]